MSEWKKVKFRDLFLDSTKNGIYKTKEFHGRGAKIINMGEIFAYSFVGSQEMSRVEINDKERDSFLVMDGDLLFARRSLIESGAGKCSIVTNISDETTFESSIIRVRLNKHLANPLFYMYWMRSLAGKTAMNGIVSGVNVKGIRASDLQNIDVDFPTLSVQNNIATILSRYDSLIENYQKQIKLLEEAAQRLYKEWFVDLHFPGHEHTKTADGVPEGWEKKRLIDLVDVQYGYAFDGKLFNNNGEGMPILRIRNIPDGITSDYTTEEASPNYIVHDGDIVVGMDGIFHINSWNGGDAYLVQRACSFRPKEENTRGFVFQAIQEPIKYFEQTLVGATVAHLGKKHIDSIELLVPANKDLYIPFQRGFMQRQALLSQIRFLTEARDRLLPKLMSGEIAV